MIKYKKYLGALMRAAAGTICAGATILIGCGYPDGRMRAIVTLASAVIFAGAALAQPRCEMVRGRLTVCTSDTGRAQHIVTSAANGRVLRLEMLIPKAATGADLLSSLVPFAVLLDDMSADQRGAFMLRVLATAKGGPDIDWHGFKWWSRIDGDRFRVVADRNP